MKTGRLLKFQRPGAEVHAYIYREGASFRAAVYVMAESGRSREKAPSESLSASTEAGVESAVREWVEARFPRT